MRLVSITIFLFSFVGAFGQTTLLPKQIDPVSVGVVYKKEWNMDLRLHTNGAALALNLGRSNSYYETKYYHFELGYLRDPRETKQNKNVTVNFGETSQGFTFGKQNSVIMLRAGWGKKVYWSEKTKRKGAVVGYSYEYGPALALLKPAYLRLVYRVQQDGVDVFELRTEKFSEENEDVFLNYDDIFGGAGFFTGFNEMSFVPGLQAKGGLHFSIGAYDKSVKALEVGLMLDVFPKKIPILVETESVSNKPYFINLYLNLQFGRRSLR